MNPIFCISLVRKFPSEKFFFTGALKNLRRKHRVVSAVKGAKLLCAEYMIVKCTVFLFQTFQKDSSNFI
jgi:hypothetical protein